MAMRMYDGNPLGKQLYHIFANEDNSKVTEWNKVFAVSQDQSHRLSKAPDNPFITYQKEDLEPLMLEEEDEQSNIAHTKEKSQ